MKNRFKQISRLFIVSVVWVAFYHSTVFYSQAAEVTSPSITKTGLKQPNYDYFVVYPTLDVPTNYQTMSIKLIQVDSQLGVASPAIVLYQKPTNGFPRSFNDIRINKDLAGLTYITFEEIWGRGITAFHEIFIPNIRSPQNFVYRSITLPAGAIVGCDQAINPATLEQYYFCGIVVGYNVPAPYLEIWLGKSFNYTNQPTWQKIYTVNQSGDFPSGITLFYDPKLNELLLRFQTNGFSIPPASYSIYEMSVDPQTLAIKSQPQIISGSNVVNDIKMPTRYSPAINVMSFPMQIARGGPAGAHFQAKISGAWQTLLSVTDAYAVEVMGTADSNLSPELFFLTARLTWGGSFGANDITGYIFSGPPLYQSLRQVPIGQVNNPNQERYGFAATLKGKYSTKVPIAVDYINSSQNKEKILFSIGDVSTGIFTPLKAVHTIDQNKEIIAPEQLAVETIP